MTPRKRATMMRGNTITTLARPLTIDKGNSSLGSVLNSISNTNIKILTFTGPGSSMEQITSTAGGGRKSTKGGTTAQPRKNSIAGPRMLLMSSSDSKEKTPDSMPKRCIETIIEPTKST